MEDALELPKELGGAQGGRAARAAARRGEAQLRAHVEVPAAHEVSLLCNELWHAPLRDRAHVPGRGVKGGWGWLTSLTMQVPAVHNARIRPLTCRRSKGRRAAGRTRGRHQ